MDCEYNFLSFDSVGFQGIAAFLQSSVGSEPSRNALSHVSYCLIHYNLAKAGLILMKKITLLVLC